jgi:hypothetical protein
VSNQSSPKGSPLVALAECGYDLASKAQMSLRFNSVHANESNNAPSVIRKLMPAPRLGEPKKESHITKASPMWGGGNKVAGGEFKDLFVFCLPCCSGHRVILRISIRLLSNYSMNAKLYRGGEDWSFVIWI